MKPAPALLGCALLAACASQDPVTSSPSVNHPVAPGATSKPVREPAAREVRPVRRSAELRARALPGNLPSYELIGEREFSERELAMLPTRDVVWRTYRDDLGGFVSLIALHHDPIWDGIPPPRSALEGAGMTVTEEGSIWLRPGQEVGRILARSRTSGSEYLSLFVYGAVGTDTFLHHELGALPPDATRGFLLRVETFVEDGLVELAEARCRDFLSLMLPEAIAVLEGER